MNRKLILASVIFVIAVSAIFFISDNIFIKRAPVPCPDEASVYSASLSYCDGVSVFPGKEEIGSLLEYISNSVPTGRQSVNDSPATSEYYITDIVTEDRSYRYYIYKEKSTVYVELPYEGIYKASDRLIVFLENILSD